jgi:spore coat polysaccharide biosynthesis protein SpsF
METVKVLAVLQARTTSTRLPGKVLLPLIGAPMILRQIERIKRAKLIDNIVVATSDERSDDELATVCQNSDIEVYRGNLDDVLDRFYHASMKYKPEQVVRLTADCPLTDPELIDKVITYHIDNNFDYTSNSLEPTYPDGLDVEVMCMRALNEAWNESVLPSEREHVTPFIHDNPSRYKVGHLKQEQDYSFFRWTVDESEDYEFVKRVYELLYLLDKKFSTENIFDLLAKNPELSSINDKLIRNESYEASLKQDEIFRQKLEGKNNN